MKSEVQAVGVWLANNKLPISLEKSTAMHYGATNICENLCHQWPVTCLSGQLYGSRCAAK